MRRHLELSPSTDLGLALGLLLLPR